MTYLQGKAVLLGHPVYFFLSASLQVAHYSFSGRYFNPSLGKCDDLLLLLLLKNEIFGRIKKKKEFTTP
jgi:hypothetical protein